VSEFSAEGIAVGAQFACNRSRAKEPLSNSDFHQARHSSGFQQPKGWASWNPALMRLDEELDPSFRWDDE
jgi:hypothetical protein